jgi:hypothetical protein
LSLTLFYTPGDGGIGVTWPAYSEPEMPYMALNGTVAVKTQLKIAQCDLWDRVYAAGCQVLNCFNNGCFCDKF